MMPQLKIILEDLALNGYGIVWNPTYEDFRPFVVEDGETIIWWDDPENCASENFVKAARATHTEMLKELNRKEANNVH